MARKYYSEIREKLNIGDIVLFSGKGAISTGIKWFTSSKWSHVGMVIKSLEWDSVLLWEATTLSDLKDIESKKETKGVQLVFLSDRIAKYDGEIAIRHLKDVSITENMMQALKDLREELKGRPYEDSEIELIKSAYDGPWGQNTRNLSSLFCSELVAEAYIRMGLLDKEEPANEYTPENFADPKIELLQGKLSKIIDVS